MRNRRTALALTAFGGLPLSLTALTVLTAAPAVAHGATGNPAARSVACHPSSHGKTNAACKAALAASPEFPGDWQSIVQGAAIKHDSEKRSSSPQHRSLIRDGQLCSAGNAKFSGLDRPDPGYPSTSLTSGAEHSFEYAISALHNPYRLEMYVTKDGYDPSKPLKWSDLEDTPFVSADNLSAVARPNAPLGSSAFAFKAQLPEKKGKHMVYTIWHGLMKPDGSAQSSEAFYSCSDVNFT
ncbi:lytic polysaccharide monooxygenase [Streptomyces sp. IBSNAI002]|uniref:lytic polysaccharide monooxygenase n=1 Tax=Streptomyces sp. IBSNAI002 TaxID=3457500 RepID=UPI003FD30557